MIDSDTTLGQVSHIIIDGIKKEFAQEFIKKGEFRDNFINADVYNVQIGSIVNILVKYKINNKEYKIEDTIDLLTFHESKYYLKQSGAFIVSGIYEKLKEDIGMAILDAIER